MKKSYLIVLLFIATVSLVACTNSSTLDKDEISSSELPTLKVVSENDSIEAEIGTSSWTITNSDGTKTTTASDFARHVELVKDVSRLKVSPESTIKLDFSDKPKEVIVNIWEEDKRLEQALTAMEVKMPELEGVVIYEVIVTLEQGTVHYAFSVDVESTQEDKLVTEIGESDKFSEAEITDAVTSVKNNFSFPKSTLTRIWYDEENSNKYVKLYLENGKGIGRGIKSENIIVLLSNFDVDKSATPEETVLTPGETVTNYQWTLIRDNKTSDWKVDTWGY